MKIRFIKPGLGILILMFFFSCQNQKSVIRKGIYNDGFELLTSVKNAISEITSADFKKIYDAGKRDIHIIDVRTQEEYDSGYIPDAVLIPRGVLEFRITDEDLWKESGKQVPEKNSFILLYCRSGGRSALAAKSFCIASVQRAKGLKYFFI